MIFISVLLFPINFSDIVMLGSGPNSCCQQNLECFDMPFLLLGLFSWKSSNELLRSRVRIEVRPTENDLTRLYINGDISVGITCS